MCPYCAVGCAQLVYVKNEKIIDIEGDPGSPISNGCLCPKGAATFQLVTGNHRVSDVLYRKPYGTEWEKIPLEQAMDMVAERIKNTRDATWEDKNKDGDPEANHAVVVTGVDTARGLVHLNDSGSRKGRDEMVPIDVFVRSWESSGQQMTVTS